MIPSSQSPSAKALQEAIRRGRDHLLGSAPPLRQATPTPPLPPCLSSLHVEELEYFSEDPENPASLPSQCWVPLRIVKKQQENPSALLPVVIFIHCTGSDKNSQAHRQAQYAERGYLTAAIDTRYHGARVDPEMPYQQAIVQSWISATAAEINTKTENQKSTERPFLLDVIWDLHRLIDYLITHRDDVDSTRIGVTGDSLGGMLSWLFAAADDRVFATAPLCGVQNFRYGIEHDVYHVRVQSIPHVFTQASKDLGKGGEVDREVVAAVLNKVMPGLLTDPPENGYDAPYSLGLIAPRPLLIVNGEIDDKTPLKGVEMAMVNARKAYKDALEVSRGSGADEVEVDERLRLFLEPNVGHEFTSIMHREVDMFMDKWLLDK